MAVEAIWNDAVIAHYPAPKPEADKVRDRIAFWRGVEIVRP